MKFTYGTQNLSTKLRTFPWVSRVPQSKFELNRYVQGFLSYDRRNKQRDKQRLQLYILITNSFTFIPIIFLLIPTHFLFYFQPSYLFNTTHKLILPFIFFILIDFHKHIFPQSKFIQILMYGMQYSLHCTLYNLDSFIFHKQYSFYKQYMHCTCTL